MKNLNAVDVQRVSGGLTYDQVIGRGFAFGSCIGLFSGAVSAFIQNQAPTAIALGAVCGTGVGGFAGAIISVPFSIFFPTDLEVTYYEIRD